MSLKFYTDSHIPGAVAVQLRAKGVDVVRCQEVELADARDVEHLEYATRSKRAIITKDRDFPALHARWMAEGRHHHGIFFCPYRHEPAVGTIVTACLFFYEVVETGAGSLDQDIKDRLYYIT